jgi:hypothetical protein
MPRRPVTITNSCSRRRRRKERISGGISASLGLPLACIGRFAAGEGLTLTENGVELPLPASLGFQHG